MNILKVTKTALIHSVIWAVLMLSLAFLIQGNEQKNIILIFMVGGWYISHATITKLVKANASESNSDKKSKVCCL